MERACEFCKVYRAVVYCIADAANLCLTCDAKVHSANSLSGRHLRTLLCDSCKNQPCVVRCLDHKLFLCHGCNDKLHCGVSSEHHKRDMKCYTGCPSAKDFAIMWGFRVMDDNHISLEQSFRMVKQPKGKYEMNKVPREGGFILEQILELEKIQLREENDGLSLTEPVDPYPLKLPQQSEEGLIDLPQTGKELIVDFSHLSSSSTLGDSLWECKSSQLWNQNLQDIGVCEDTVCKDDDDFHIPDIDLTFRNFEELFGADQDPVADNKNVFFVSSQDKSREMKTYSTSFSHSSFATEPASSSISFRSSETDYPYNNSQEVISFCSPLSNNARQKAISKTQGKEESTSGGETCLVWSPEKKMQ